MLQKKFFSISCLNYRCVLAIFFSQKIKHSLNEIRKRGADAKAEIAQGGLLVKQGSEIATSDAPSIPQRLIEKRQELIEKKVVVRKGTKFVFSKDYLFTSPSQAAGIVMGRSANGRTEWKDEKGKELKFYQEKIIDRS